LDAREKDLERLVGFGGEGFTEYRLAHAVEPEGSNVYAELAPT
jgi:hypothetical protein